MSYRIPALILVALCHIIAIYFISDHKYSKNRFIANSCIFAAGFIIIGSLECMTSGAVAFFVYVCVVLWTFAFSCWVSEDRTAKKWFLFITYFCLFTALDNVIKYAAQFLPFLGDAAQYHVSIVVRSVLLMLILIPYRKYAFWIVRSIKDVNSRRWWSLGAIAFMFYVLQVAVSVFRSADILMPFAYFAVFGVISVIMCAVYIVVFNNIKYMQKELDVNLVRQNMEHLYDRLVDMQNADEAHRRLRHDLHQHLLIIAEYAKKGDADAIVSYIKEYEIDVSGAAVKQYSANMMINTILAIYAKKAAKKNVVFTVKCNAPSELSVRNIDMTALLGNMLENAMHACGNSGKPEQVVDVRIRVQNSRLIIVCNNTCSDALKLCDGLPEGKSVGILSILEVCRRYDGNLDYSIEDGMCSACAVLNV